MCKQKITWIILPILTCISFYAKSQIQYNAEEAFTLSRQTGRPVLLIFAGSDWCLPCIRFDKFILSDSSFLALTDKKLIILKSEFLQRRKLPQAVQSQNEMLAAKYNPEGQFPYLLLLNSDKSVLATVSYFDQTPQEFTEQINFHLKLFPMPKEFRKETRLMGSSFEFIIVNTGEEDGSKLIDESINEVKRIESLLTEFSPTSQTSMLNNFAGEKPIQVDSEVYNIIKRSITISKLTQGAFDITSGILKNLFHFKGGQISIPENEMILDTLRKVGYTNIQLLDENKVFLRKQGMHIGFGAIGKGYAADKVKAMLLAKGIKSGVINASGDLTVWGTRQDGLPWKVGIADPEDSTKILLWLPLENASVATSGNYEQYFEIDGTRYAHIIDPKSGLPVKDIKSVTVISPSAELSDALATAVFVMGTEAGLYMIDQLPDTHCIIIDEKNKIHFSKQLKPETTISK